MVCDTNILIYAAQLDDAKCLPYVESPQAIIASVTRIEALGFRGFLLLEAARRARIESLVFSLIEVPLDERIIRQAVALRQLRKMGLADAVIAATALEFDVPLVTRNEDDFSHVPGLRLINPFAV